MLGVPRYVAVGFPGSAGWRLGSPMAAPRSEGCSAPGRGGVSVRGDRTGSARAAVGVLGAGGARVRGGGERGRSAPGSPHAWGARRGRVPLQGGVLWPGSPLFFGWDAWGWGVLEECGDAVCLGGGAMWGRVFQPPPGSGPCDVERSLGSFLSGAGGCRAVLSWGSRPGAGGAAGR